MEKVLYTPFANFLPYHKYKKTYIESYREFAEALKNFQHVCANK